MGDPIGKIVVILGVRADGSLHTLELTDDDILKVALTTATGSDLLTELEAKLETADLELVSKIQSVGPHGWIGSALQKQPMLLGYSDVIRNATNDTNLSAGIVSHASGAVPAGEIWIVTNIAYSYEGTIPGKIRVSILSSTVRYVIAMDRQLETAVFVSHQGYWVMDEGEQIDLRMYDATAGDNIYLDLIAIRVDVDQ